jgi:hypothetical protein
VIWLLIPAAVFGVGYLVIAWRRASDVIRDAQVKR